MPAECPHCGIELSPDVNLAGYILETYQLALDGGNATRVECFECGADLDPEARLEVGEDAVLCARVPKAPADPDEHVLVWVGHHAERWMVGGRTARLPLGLWNAIKAVPCLRLEGWTGVRLGALVVGAIGVGAAAAVDGDYLIPAVAIAGVAVLGVVGLTALLQRRHPAVREAADIIRTQLEPGSDAYAKAVRWLRRTALVSPAIDLVVRELDRR
ncbi:MAG: hypothetical protein GF320_00785 [Armatimonadia bacterium]|nr:hypothetical protein [Armatimonadia bacterium]